MNVKELITQHEGIKLHPYKDTRGILTIGIGRNLENNGISQEEAEFMRDNDIKKCEEQLTKALPWFVNLDEVRQAVLIDMCFELGLEGLLKFKNTLGLIQQGDWEKAADSMKLSLWARQVPTRCIQNAQMLKTGQWVEEK